MAFSDDLTRDPKSKKEFWAIVEETFEQVEGALTDYPAETREEALAGTLRGGNFKDASLSFIRHRGVREDLDSRDYFLELGREFLPKVERQIKDRQLTPKFAKDWGVIMMCHGFISAHILDDSDGLNTLRITMRGGEGRRLGAERKTKFVAALVHHWMEVHGKKRPFAEREVAKAIERFLRKPTHLVGFDSDWFASLLAKKTPKDTSTRLKSTYTKHLKTRRLLSLAAQPRHDIPPPDDFLPEAQLPGF
jgi:hypothetical protein